jgi:signal transduction histidine kinase
MTYLIVLLFLIILALALSLFFSYKKTKSLVDMVDNLKFQIQQKDKEFDRRVYELAILKELDDRIGYFLDVEKIVDIITGSLGQFIDYNVAAYLLIDGEQLNFKVHVEKSVSHAFVDDVKGRMTKSLSALLNKDLESMNIENFVSGAVLVDDIEEPVKSFFNIPLVIGGEAAGVLTVAHTKDDMYHEEDMTILYKITNDASRAVSRLQEVVQSEQQKLNAMMASMSDGVVMTDLDYRIVVINKAAQKAVGISENKEQITIFDFIDKLSTKFDIRGRLEESVKLDKVIRADDIELFNKHFQVTVLPVTRGVGKEKKTIGGVVIFHDISSEKEAEKIQEEFTSMLVHELRTPLDGVKKIIERVKSGKKLAKTKKDHYFDMAHDSLSGMLNLVNDILDVAKFESGKFTVQKVSDNIKDIISQRIEFFEQSAKTSQISLVKEVDKNLPDQVPIDSNRIGQVLNNILGNAIKFTGPGGIISINTLVYSPGDNINNVSKYLKFRNLTKGDKDLLNTLPKSILLSVSDTGVGISKEEVDDLFSKFSQARRNSLKKGGSGLGLVIAKNIVEAHGGIIGLTTKEGEGTTLYFSIPMEE